MTQRYMVERRKRGARDFYTLGTHEGQTMRDVAGRAVPDFAPGDSIRLTLLSVSLTATLTEVGTWEVEPQSL